MKRWMEVFNSVAAIVFCVAAVCYGWQVVKTAWLIDERSASDLRFPMWIYYAALPTGGVLMLMRYIIRLAGLVATSRWNAMLPQHAGARELPQISEPAQ
jgi:TRAP-type C4-dicarboxylate transport system permease small subunit